MTTDPGSGPAEQLLETPDLARALDSDQFKLFLDSVPVAIAVSELHPAERIVYANEEFERLTGKPPAEIVGRVWNDLPGDPVEPSEPRRLGVAVSEERDYLGAFTMTSGGRTIVVDAWSNIIDAEDGAARFRLVALVEAVKTEPEVLDALHERVREKDTQLFELQHRVKNNLQMITALIRAEARGAADRSTGEGFQRLAGRIEALGLLYHALAVEHSDGSVDLGIYLSEIASAVMRAHAVEGIRLNLQVDTWLVSVNVAMPAGLVVNELMTNALKHAFVGREGGTISLKSVTGPNGCRVTVSDDGVGLPAGGTWPMTGKLSALIVRSLIQNAKASIKVDSEPGHGVKVTIDFRREDAVA
jgi:PAS domain S-box-containing protein